ncbi:hypothetical protein V118_02643, partial [Staphylococcus aureus 16(11S1S4-09)]
SFLLKLYYKFNFATEPYSPKGEDISGIFNSQIQEWANKLNTRPRKCLNWKTPYEVFFNESLHLI